MFWSLNCTPNELKYLLKSFSIYETVQAHSGPVRLFLIEPRVAYPEPFSTRVLAI